MARWGLPPHTANDLPSRHLAQREMAEPSIHRPSTRQSKLPRPQAAGQSNSPPDPISRIPSASKVMSAYILVRAQLSSPPPHHLREPAAVMIRPSPINGIHIQTSATVTGTTA